MLSITNSSDRLSDRKTRKLKRDDEKRATASRENRSSDARYSIKRELAIAARESAYIMQQPWCNDRVNRTLRSTGDSYRDLVLNFDPGWQARASRSFDTGSIVLKIEQLASISKFAMIVSLLCDTEVRVIRVW